MITVKNRPSNALTEGMSASGAVAVGLVAAWRGDDIKSQVILTEKIMPDGRVEPVGDARGSLSAHDGAKTLTNC